MPMYCSEVGAAAHVCVTIVHSTHTVKGQLRVLQTEADARELSIQVS